jgi:glycosyltransferase involved in cell wall biosynthesis
MSLSIKKDLSIVIPSYNEIGNLKKLLNQVNNILIKNNNIEFIIVNNGSIDGTKEYLKINKHIFPKIKFVTVKKNIGYGHGIKYGLKFTTSDIISWTHADLQIDINDVVNHFKKYFPKIKKKKILIKGRRINRSIFNTFFTDSMSFIVYLIFNVKINDINGQPKIFSKVFVDKILKYGPNDFTIDLFLLLLVKKNNYMIKEFPLKFKNRLNDKAKGGGTFIGKVKLTIATLKFICLLKFNFSHKLWK